MAAATTTTRSADYASALFSSPPPRKRKPLEAVEATASPAANCGAAAPESQGAPAKRAKETDAQPAAGESAGGGRAAAAAGGDDCPVCLAPMRAGEMALFTTTCGHAYHFKCLRSCILNRTTNCPVCRRDFAAMTPPITRPKGRSIGTVVEKNLLLVRSGTPFLDVLADPGKGRRKNIAVVRGLVTLEQNGKLLAVPADGNHDLSRVSCIVKVQARMPRSDYWKIGSADRQLVFGDISGLNEMQQAALKETQSRLLSAAIDKGRLGGRDPDASA